jgi:hypothetical protein
MEVTGGGGGLLECLDLGRTEAIQFFLPCLYIATLVVAVGQLPAVLVADAPVDKERGAELVHQLGPLEVLQHEIALGLCWVDHVLVSGVFRGRCKMVGYEMPEALLQVTQGGGDSFKQQDSFQHSRKVQGGKEGKGARTNQRLLRL